MCVTVAVFISLLQGKEEHPNAIEIGDIDFSTTRTFNVATLGTIAILIALYATWW